MARVPCTFPTAPQQLRMESLVRHAHLVCLALPVTALHMHTVPSPGPVTSNASGPHIAGWTCWHPEALVYGEQRTVQLDLGLCSSVSAAWL